jgi:hypothetical protein
VRSEGFFGGNVSNQAVSQLDWKRERECAASLQIQTVLAEELRRIGQEDGWSELNRLTLI